MNDSTKPTARTYRVWGDRIGRVKRPWEVVLTATSDLDLEDQLWEFFDPKLASSDFVVTVHLDEGRGSIEFGRFGDFGIDELGEGVEA